MLQKEEHVKCCQATKKLSFISVKHSQHKHKLLVARRNIKVIIPRLSVKRESLNVEDTLEL